MRRQELRLLLREQRGDRAVAVLGMRPMMRAVLPPAPKLRVQVLDIDKRAASSDMSRVEIDVAATSPQ